MDLDPLAKLVICELITRSATAILVAVLELCSSSVLPRHVRVYLLLGGLLLLLIGSCHDFFTILIQFIHEFRDATFVV